MKILKSATAAIVAFTAFVSLSCSSNAQKAELPTTYVAVSNFEGTDLKATAAPKAKTTAPAKYGEIFILTEAPQGGFVKARNIATGAEGYLDTFQINRSAYPLLAPELAEKEIDEPFLLNIETLSGGEITIGWGFWKAPDGSVRALQNYTTAYNDGRVRTNQTYYKGVAKDGYLLLSESVEYGEDNGIKLDEPIIIWEDVVGRAGVFVDGKCFTPGGQLGGFDTDDWGD